jgi:cell wall-associated NlpC family hydrolase
MTIYEEIAAEARSWVGTPYVRKGSVKGAAIDCGMLPYCVLRKFNLIPEFQPDWLSDDWWQHASDERYLLMIQRYLKKLITCRVYRDTKVPLGALVLTKAYRSPRFNHAGICVGWPQVVHSVVPSAQEINVVFHPMWEKKELVVFDSVGGTLVR